MAWERREGGRQYYYRKVKEDGRVRSVYLGRDAVGEAGAAIDEFRRAVADEEEQAHRETLARLDAAAAYADEAGNRAALIAEAAMLAAGFHRVRRQWRRKRHGTQPRN